MCSNRRGHWRLAGAWLVRMVRPLFMASPNLTALNSGPYAPMIDTVPPLRTESIAQLRATGDPPCSSNLDDETCLLLGEPGRGAPRTPVRARHPHESCLTPVAPAAGVGVAVDASHCRGVRIHVMAVQVQTPRAEIARAAVDVERHHDPVSDR